MQAIDVTEANLAAVLDLNESSVPHVNSIDLDQFRWFADQAFYFRVVLVANELAGFLVGLRPGVNYGSENYKWFCEHYRDFGYIDRVAVAPNFRRLGVASVLYEDFANKLTGQVNVMTCEVNIRPANESSMRYHEQHGFRQIGSQQTENGSKEVALMEKRL